MVFVPSLRVRRKKEVGGNDLGSRKDDRAWVSDTINSIKLPEQVGQLSPKEQTDNFFRLRGKSRRSIVKENIVFIFMKIFKNKTCLSCPKC
jgi:hypothetical protein